MELNKRLPEKAHYGQDEFCKLMEIDHETLNHYVRDMQILRYALPVKRLDPCIVFPLTEDEFIYLSDELLHYDLYFEERDIFWPDEIIQAIPLDRFNVSEINDWLTKNIPNRKAWTAPISAPNYLYVLAHPIYQIFRKGIPERATFFFEDFTQNKFILLKDNKKYPESLLPVLPIRDYLLDFEPTTVITREEKDRFISIFNESEKSDRKSTGDGISPKTRNAYLRTINALSSALIDGLTEAPNTDANAIMAALELKGISPPVGLKTLAAYLRESNDLE